MRRARDGDDAAFEEIVRRYRAPLIRYSSRHVGRDHAEDVTQHALASAAMHLRDDPRPIHLRAWLYRVAHNAAINMRQRKDWGHEQLSPDIDGVPQPPDLAQQRSDVREVVSELDRLPDRQRTALLLSVFEGLGYEEIAARLDTSPNSVRALLSRARVHLRKAAAAIAPLPLLQSLLRKVSGAASAASGQGTIAAGSSVVQAKLIAVAATTVVAGAAGVENATSNAPDPITAGDPGTVVADVPAIPDAVVPVDVHHMLPDLATPATAGAKPEPTPVADAPLAEPPLAEPVVPVIPPPLDPISEAPAPPALPVEELPPAEPPAEDPGKDDYQSELPPPDGNPPGPPDGNPPPDDYTAPPPDDSIEPPPASDGEPPPEGNAEPPPEGSAELLA